MGYKSMETQVNQSLIRIIQGNITEQNTMAIVNAANSQLIGGAGVDGAIRNAGGPTITEECDQIRRKQGGCPTGQSVITTGGNLEAAHVIHTVGPVWKGGSANEAKLLANCYQSCLELAVTHEITSLSFPSISTGIYGYPIEKAATTALSSVDEFLRQSNMLKEIRFVLFGSTDYSIYQQIATGILQ